ncbi:N-acetylglucosamine-6-phosphate deacetylase [Paracoccus sp. M683]|uniref:N-acetylglucosamine-6-phosphate deacetylase n=1 Tax=Paracoccus sp. M683 TaxID=2594268 RepID=UPI00117FB98B|nr:N-acetylglucosamine-6-phosphate deacetylase [Paracoccus sp. M683]TRW97730.1 N-acetylglucosamine-6-phosphate deacetylase [Paracoccus sp. M683]
MTQGVLVGRAVFDGARLWPETGVVIRDGRIEALIPAASAPAGAQRHEGVITPGFVDLQVNGGGGLAVGAGTDAAALARICATHRSLGSAGCLPTLITDTPEVTASVLAAGVEAARRGFPGFMGLHIEGPHLDPRRQGAHDPALIRPMGPEDLDRLCVAARALPALMVTLAPEAAQPEQIAALSQAGAVVSLGHSDCSYEQAIAAMRAGARCVTHLFNAMSQIGHRTPGLAGAALASDCAVGLIADGFHVHPATMRLSLAARGQGVFLVSDCMALAGTDQQEIQLHGRRIRREGGRLVLPDGTLAGADLTLPRAVQVLVEQVGIPVERALAMASSVPAAVVGAAGEYGAIAPGRRADLLLLGADLGPVGAIWEGVAHPLRSA